MGTLHSTTFSCSCIATQVSPLAIAIFLKYNSDPVISSLSQDIFRVVGSNPGCSPALQARLAPTLLSILEASEDKNGLKGTALEVRLVLIASVAKTSNI